jgi:hypothetical protein
MPELALHIAHFESLKRLEKFLLQRDARSLCLPTPSFGFEQQGWSRFLEANQGWLPQAKVTRIYLGSEFCRWLQPSPEEERAGFETIAKQGFRGTLVLPVVPQTMHKGLAERVARASQGTAGFEVVCNDWGTAALLSKAGFEVVAGRFLFRMKRMPRISGSTVPEHSGAGTSKEMLQRQLQEWREIPTNAPWFADFLRSQGVCRAECELTPNGYTVRPHEGISLSLLAPWSYVTGGGTCPLETLVEDGDTVSCLQRCKTSYIVPQYPSKTRPTVQIGHTVFSKFEHFYKLQGDVFDRIVLEPGIPM